MRLTPYIINEVIKMYTNEQIGCVLIGRKLGISYQTALRIIKSSGMLIRRRGGTGGQRNKISNELKKQIIDSYLAGNLTITEVAQNAMISKNAAYKVLREAQIKMNAPGRKGKAREPVVVKQRPVRLSETKAYKFLFEK